MNRILFYFLIVISVSAYSQENEFLLQGKIIGVDAKPIADAYILRNKKFQNNISNASGNFNIWVQHGDSLTISHISYNKKIIYIDSQINNPIIILTPVSRDILAVNVSPNFKSDYKLARNNLASLGELKIIPYVKIKLEPDPVLEMATENNRLMRTEAASISLFRFSFTQQIINSKQNIQHHKESKHYSSTRELK